MSCVKILKVKRVACALVAVFFLASVAPRSWAWGVEGHHIVALIAQKYLTSKTSSQLKELMGGETLVSVSTWPDEIRKDRDETAGWHYVDIPTNAAYFNDARDCYQPYSNHKNAATDRYNCVVDRIDMFARVLGDDNQPKEARLEALKFLVHFVGDIHQPMHAIEEAAGGNQIKVVLFGNASCGENRPCNLHGVWDGGLIEHTKLDETAYAKQLESTIKSSRLAERPEGTPADWANESHQLAEGALLPPGGAVDQVYFNHEISVVDERLALAGLRLAHMLNTIFDQQ